MNINAIRNIYFLGIGGIGMSALARFFVQQGAHVSGYDRTPTSLTRDLEMMGITIHYEENTELLPANLDLAVYTPAIPAESIELKHLIDSGIPVVKRARLLAELTKDHFTIAVAGTHGKTTITSIITHILISAGIPVTAFIGGIANNFQSNFVHRQGSKIMVVEADEFDQSFLQLTPDIAVVSSMDADHLDIYQEHGSLMGAYQNFVNRIKLNGHLVVREGVVLTTDNKSTHYGLNPDADVFADEIQVQNGKFSFEIHSIHGDKCAVQWLIPGRHNIENALAAVSAGLILGISLDRLCASLGTYLGVKRRFEFRICQPDLCFIDDYAHHPEELKACIGAARELFPGKRITGVFQPHLFSRTRDFMNEFAQSLSMLDEVLLLDIYAAREMPINGISSAELLKRIPSDNKWLVSREKIIETIVGLKPEVLLTLGAGDIDLLVEPIEKALTQ
jgi:UDP-N-acetylmuramate--alanine ligase